MDIIEKVIIIAEAGVNHNGKLNIAFKMIDEASKAKVDAVKFQLYRSERLVSRNLPMSDYQKKNIGRAMKQFEMLKRCELSEADFRKLVKHAKERNIMLLATPFDRESADLLALLKRPYIKIDSGSITDYPFLEYVAKKMIPLILSTGASTMKEVREAVRVIKRHNHDIALLHCTCMYPAPYDHINLLAIKEMMHKFDCPIGYSDHTIGIEISIAAIAVGAKIIEKHFTLDRSLEGPDHKISLEPKELRIMVNSLRNVEKAMGRSEKKPCAEEAIIMKLGRHSVVAAADLKKGNKIKEKDVVVKRPGTGIMPKDLKNIMGKQLVCDVAKDTPLEYSYIEGA